MARQTLCFSKYGVCVSWSVLRRYDTNACSCGFKRTSRKTLIDRVPWLLLHRWAEVVFSDRQLNLFWIAVKNKTHSQDFKQSIAQEEARPEAEYVKLYTAKLLRLVYFYSMVLGQVVCGTSQFVATPVNQDSHGLSSVLCMVRGIELSEQGYPRTPR